MYFCSKYYNKINNFYNIVKKKKNLKNLTIFLLINFLFMFVEVFFGLISNCLGLLTDGAHMLLDCSAVIIGLYSSYLSEFPSNSKFEFGYFRSEILGTFINSVFLIFIAIYILFESIERFISPKDIHSENLILVSFLGLVVNIIGLIIAHDHGDDDDEEDKNNSNDLINNENCHIEVLDINENNNLEENNEKINEYDKKIEEKSDLNKNYPEHKENNHHNHHHNTHNHHHHHHNDNLYAIYIHILADTLGSVAVLISSYLIRYHNIKISDPICSLLISTMIIYSTIPVLKNSTMILLHIPDNEVLFKEGKIKEKCHEFFDKGFIVNSIDIWKLKRGNFVCEVKFNKNLNNDLHNKKLLYNNLKETMKELKIKEYYIDI